MPLVGVAIGHVVGRVLGDWSSFVGALALLAVSVWFIFFDHDRDADESNVGALGLWSILGLALSISIDEVAAGFSIGLIGIPVALTIVLIAIEAIIFSAAGLALGQRLKPYLGEWAEKVAGIVLGLLGVWLLIQIVPTLFGR
jgi:putative Mn2+ efflux pump MntP